MHTSEAAERAERVLAALRGQLEPAQLEWLERVSPASPAFSRADFAAVFAGAQRRFRAAVAPLAQAQRAALQAEGLIEPEALTLSARVRAVLLLRALAVLPEAEHVPLVGELVRKGDTAERVAVLRSLVLLPEPSRFAPLAIDACRSHVQEVFEAVACDNAFPAAHFPAPSFNQLLMKAMFTDVPLDRVHGWRQRANPELLRMATDFAAERRAAGRPVPDGVAAIHATMESR